MRVSYLAYTVSLALRFFSIVFFVPILAALFYNEENFGTPFLISGACALLLGFLIKIIFCSKFEIKSLNDIKKSEGLCAVTFVWLLAGLFTSVPYLFYGLSPINAIFEATSGITATGATILTTFDYPHSIMFWRSFSQWLGGMGIIVLFIAVLPQFSIAGRQLFSAEAPGPIEDKFTPRIKNTASALWKIYAGLTIIEAVCLKFAGMSWFNSVCHSLSTVSGGGFSPDSVSLIGCTHWVLWIVCIVMFFAGSNYSLQYKVLSKFDFKLLFKNEEFKVYFGIMLFLSVFTSMSLFCNSHYNLFDSITNACFQVTSLMSTTGFCSSDFVSWDYTSKAVLFLAILAGSCASSAGGGIKLVRLILIFKIMKSQLIKILHPHAVYTVKIGKYTVDKNILFQTLMFVSFYIVFIVLFGFIISIFEQNATIGLTSTISAIGNVGPALCKTIGPISNYDSFHNISKFILIIAMYAGRLELVPFLVLFQREVWNVK